MGIYRDLDKVFTRRSPIQVTALALLFAVVVGYVDFVTGSEVSLGLFYVAPVAIAAWYVGLWTGVTLAIFCSIAWFIAGNDVHYSHPAIPYWNALIRLGFFLVSGLSLSALRESVIRERYLSQMDALTGLYNRRVFEERLGHDLVSTKRRNKPLTLAYIDLDNFKSVNDNFGHAEGDRVLQTTGEILFQRVREVDTVARLGGDEFALILPDTDKEGAFEVISDLNDNLRKAFKELNKNVACSIGVVTFLNADISVENAVKAADAKMYSAKRRGKDTMVFSVYGEETRK